MRTVSVTSATTLLLAVSLTARGDYESTYYPDPGLITVQRNGTLIDYLSCQRIALDNSWLYGMGQTNTARSSNGDIWSCVGWDVGDQYGPEALFRSQDGGVTWTYSMLPYTDGDFDIQGFTVLNDDTMVMATNRNFNIGPRDHINIYTSTDTGINWTHATTLLPTPYQYIGEGFMSMTQISNGYLLLPTARWNDDPYNTSGLNLRQDLFVSTDSGATFPTTYPTFSTTSPPFAWCMETHVIELQSGKLLAAIRHQRSRLPGETDEEILALGGNTDPELPFAFKHVFLGDSDDQGITWAHFRPVRDPNGYPLLEFGQAHGQLVQVPDGRVVLVYDHRIPNEQRDIRALVSWDDGQSWESEIHYLSFGRGYASSAALEDGTIVTVTGNTPYGPSGRAGPWSARVIRWQLLSRNQLDADSDNIPDVRDNCPSTTNPDQTDGDSDGVGDVCDNCQNTPNADQADLDYDGTGDVCDDDADGDGLLNTNDNCPMAANPGQEDGDSDGVGDACDDCPDTLPGLQVDEWGCPPPVPGDMDRDGDVDQSDFGLFQACLSGAGITQNKPNCLSARLDADSDVDAGDFAIFQAHMSGPNTIAVP